MTEAEKERAAVIDYITVRTIAHPGPPNGPDWKILLWCLLHPFKSERWLGWAQAALDIRNAIESGEHLKEGR